MENKHETQHPLISMLKEWKNALDKGEYIRVLFMDLSKKPLMRAVFNKFYLVHP